MPAIKRVIRLIENTLVAAIPNNPNKLINVASLVPNPAILIGIKETSVAKGKILR